MRKLVALLALAGLWAPVDGRLQAKRSAAQAAAERRLEAEAAHLARALRRELPSVPQEALIAAARQRLGQEASMMMDDDRLGSALMRDYAERAPAPLLIFSAPAGLGPEEDDDDMWPAAQAPPMPFGGLPGGLPGAFFGSPGMAPAWGPLPSMQSQEVSEETVVRNDGHGHLVRQTVRCKNGVCEEQEQLAAAPLQPQAVLSSQQAASVQEAMKRMAKEMRTVQASLGREGLERAVADLFRSRELTPLAEQGNAAPRTMSAKAPSEASSKSASAAATAAPMVKPKVAATPPVPPPVAAPSAAAEKATSTSRTISTQTVVKDGKIVQRVERCENGKCETKVISEDVPGAAQPKRKAPIVPLLQKRKFRRGKPLASFTHQKK